MNSLQVATELLPGGHVFNWCYAQSLFTLIKGYRLGAFVDSSLTTLSYNVSDCEPVMSRGVDFRQSSGPDPTTLQVNCE